MQAYRRVLEHVKGATGLPDSRILDVRGNHDTFDVPTRCKALTQHDQQTASALPHGLERGLYQGQQAHLLLPQSHVCLFPARAICCTWPSAAALPCQRIAASCSLCATLPAKPAIPSYRPGDFFSQYSAQGRRNGTACLTATPLVPATLAGGCPPAVLLGVSSSVSRLPSGCCCLMPTAARHCRPSCASSARDRATNHMHPCDGRSGRLLKPLQAAKCQHKPQGPLCWLTASCWRHASRSADILSLPRAHDSDPVAQGCGDPHAVLCCPVSRWAYVHTCNSLLTAGGPDTGARSTWPNKLCGHRRPPDHAGAVRSAAATGSRAQVQRLQCMRCPVQKPSDVTAVRMATCMLACAASH